MNAMDELFELYTVYFDHLEADFDRLHREKPNLNPGPMLAKRMTREGFAQYLNNGRDSESKRLFLKRILRGNEHLSSLLPPSLKLLAERAA